MVIHITIPLKYYWYLYQGTTSEPNGYVSSVLDKRLCLTFLLLIAQYRSLREVDSFPVDHSAWLVVSRSLSIPHSNHQVCVKLSLSDPHRVTSSRSRVNNHFEIFHLIWPPPPPHDPSNAKTLPLNRSPLGATLIVFFTDNWLEALFLFVLYGHCTRVPWVA